MRARSWKNPAISLKPRLMLTVSEVRKAYGGRVLFDDVTTSFEPGNRYGLTVGF